MKTLLVVEDDAGIRETLVDFLEARGYRVLGAGTVRAAEEIIGRDRPHLALLDLRLPDGDGLDVLTRLRDRGSTLPVIAVTARGDERQRIAGLAAGADDYVVKPFSLEELEARIEAVLRRAGPPETLRLGEAEVDLDGYQVLRDGETHPLLQQEAALLGFLAGNAGRAFSRSELLRFVWGYEAVPTTRTIDTHVFKLRQKIERDPANPRHLLTVRGVGYRLVIEP